MAEMLIRPAFPQDKIDLEKTQQRTAITRRNDDIFRIAFREFDKLIFGAQSAQAVTQNRAPLTPSPGLISSTSIGAISIRTIVK